MQYKILVIEFGLNDSTFLKKKLHFDNKNINLLNSDNFFDIAEILYTKNITTVLFSDYKEETKTMIFLKMLLKAFPEVKVIILGKKNTIKNKMLFIQQGALNYIPESDFENYRSIIEQHYLSMLVKPGNSQLSPTTNLILRTMKDNYYIKNNPLMVIAQKTNYSASTIHQNIKRETGKTAGRWITELRINAAINLLEATDLPIKNITREVGFKSEQGLIKAFKKVTHKTPTQYRNDYTKKKRF